MGTDAGDGLLAGVRVLELAVWRPGPYTVQLLGELGAEVIKVEPPGGDPMRHYPDLFATLAAGKRSVVLDLKQEGDRRRALDLADQADVVVEGFRPGVADRLGVGYGAVAARNPSVVYCSISGFGQDGPLATVPGHDINYLAWAGALAPDGGPPATPALPVGDLASGLAGAFAVCAALAGRARTGEGEHIDLAMADVMATWTGTASNRAATGDAGNRGLPGYGIYPTADGRYLALGVVAEDHFWSALCGVLGLDDLAGIGFGERSDRHDELDRSVAAAVRTRRGEELVEALLSADVPVAPVLDRSSMAALPNFRARRAVTSEPWSDPATGFAVKLTRHPARRSGPPPEVDEHPDVRFKPRSGS